MTEKMIDEIANDVRLSLCDKIIKLWAISMLHYRTKIGDKAWNTIAKLTNYDVSSAIAFISGYSTGIGMQPGKIDEKMKSLLEGYDEKDEKKTKDVFQIKTKKENV